MTRRDAPMVDRYAIMDVQFGINGVYAFCLYRGDEVVCSTFEDTVRWCWTLPHKTRVLVDGGTAKLSCGVAGTFVECMGRHRVARYPDTSFLILKQPEAM